MGKARIVVVDHGLARMDRIHPDLGLVHGVRHALAFGAAELRFGAGAPGLQGQGLLIGLHKVEEADATAREVFGLIQGGSEDFLQGGRGGLLGEAGAGGEDGFGELVPGDVFEGHQHRTPRDGLRRDFQPEGVTAGLHHPHNFARDRFAGPERDGGGRVLRGQHRTLGGQQVGPGLGQAAAHQHFPLDAQNPAGGGIGLEILPLGVGQQHPQRQALQQGGPAWRRIIAGRDGCFGHGNHGGVENLPY